MPIPRALAPVERVLPDASIPQVSSSFRRILMRKPISPRLHGVLDYATVATLAAAPRMMNFPARATRTADALAGSYGGLSAFTDYPLAVRRTIPFKAHGAAELASGVALPLLPWLLGFSEHKAARNFFLGLTALTFVVAALTDWDAED